MEDYLYQKDLYLPLGGKSKQPMAMKNEEWEVNLDRKTLGTIPLCFASSVAFNISKEKTIESVMNALAKLYKETSASNKAFLMKRLFNMKMSKGGYVVDRLNEFNMITNQRSFVKVNFEDKVGALLILCSFPESCNNLVMVLSNYVPSSNNLMFDDVVGVILRKEMRRRCICEASGNALTMERRGRQG